MIKVYQYQGERELMYPGSGKWMRIKPGDILLIKHFRCKNCNECPGESLVIDPEIAKPICFRSEKTGNQSSFPLKEVMNYDIDDFKPGEKKKGRLLRPFDVL